MKTIIFALPLLSLIACGGNHEAHHTASSTTAPFIQKDSVFSGQGLETTPVLFNGELIYVSDYTENRMRTRVFRQSTGETLFDGALGIGLISAIVHNGNLYIFGSNEQHTEIDMVSTTDLINWTAPVKIFDKPLFGGGLWNSSVTMNADGYFIMAYEFGGGGYWTTGFLISGDLVHWMQIGAAYDPIYMTACPTIRHIDGWYYVFFTSHYLGGTDGHGVFMTNVSRSKDLINWQFSPTTVISPMDGGDISNNASDMDLIEVNNQVRIVYLNVSQWNISIPNSGIREARYNGTMAQFVAEFF